ncbi:hypothetical protein AN958_09038 [Leucoagaricus sp. SymC.cos]|nr:hypothetical protein AN958_09038 [Leucoagaricus sp. SymC.cos]
MSCCDLQPAERNGYIYSILYDIPLLWTEQQLNKLPQTLTYQRCIIRIHPAINYLIGKKNDLIQLIMAVLVYFSSFSSPLAEESMRKTQLLTGSRRTAGKCRLFMWMVEGSNLKRPTLDAGGLSGSDALTLRRRASLEAGAQSRCFLWGRVKGNGLCIDDVTYMNLAEVDETKIHSSESTCFWISE